MSVDAETDAADREVEEINGVASENGCKENARVDEAEIEQANRTDKEKSEERVDSPAEAVADRAELFAKGLAFEVEEEKNPERRLHLRIIEERCF